MSITEKYYSDPKYFEIKSNLDSRINRFLDQVKREKHSFDEDFIRKAFLFVVMNQIEEVFYPEEHSNLMKEESGSCCGGVCFPNPDKARENERL